MTHCVERNKRREEGEEGEEGDNGGRSETVVKRRKSSSSQASADFIRSRYRQFCHF